MAELKQEQVEAAIVEQLLNRSRRAAERAAEPVNGQPGTLLRAEFTGTTPLDYLAAQAPKEIPNWFRAKHEPTVAVVKPDSVLRFEDASDRHTNEFDRQSGPVNDAWHARRAASIEVVNGLYKLAEKDRAAWSLAQAEASGIAAIHLAARWSYFWARQVLAVRGEQSR